MSTTAETPIQAFDKDGLYKAVEDALDNDTPVIVCVENGTGFVRHEYTPEGRPLLKGEIVLSVGTHEAPIPKDEHAQLHAHLEKRNHVAKAVTLNIPEHFDISWFRKGQQMVVLLDKDDEVLDVKPSLKKVERNPLGVRAITLDWTPALGEGLA
jgi:hypothetical protein